VSTRQQVIYIAANPHEAQLLRLALEDHDIEAFVINDTLNSVHFAAGDLLVRAAGGAGFLPTAPRVVVDEQDAVRAREIALQHEKDLRDGVFSTELAQLETEVGEDDWPKCPHCSRPRLATCPVCQTSASHFPSAFMLGASGEESEGKRPLVICSTCDEAFNPKFPARCEWCGHRFADGVEPPTVNLYEMPAIFRPGSDFNGRVIGLMAGVAGALAALATWFYFVLR